MIQKLTDLVIKPYRPSYDPKVDLGPTTFSIDNKYLGARIDFKITNRRNQTLECSLFRRTVEKNKKYPLIVFCHGNTGNRTNSYGAVYSMLRAKVNVLTFDFAGCGLSGGKTISLGYYEQDDIADVLDYIVTKYSFVDMNRIGLWGRCMGAVSSLLLASRNDYISLLVLDTPFADFPAMLRDYIQRVKIIPKWAENYIYDNLRTKIKEQANFDFEDVVPVNHVAKCKIPAILVHGTKDGIVPPHSFKRIYDAYPGPKEYIELETSHNDARPDFVYQKIANFVQAEFFAKSQSRESNSKKMNPSLNTEPFTQPKFVSLDSIRFNESMFDFQGKEGLDPVQKAFDDLRTEKTNEFSDFWDTTNGVYEQIISTPYYKDTKGKIRPKMTSTQSLEKKKFTFPQVDEDEEADISEEMSFDADTINHDLLKFGNTKRFLHNLQNQPH